MPAVKSLYHVASDAPQCSISCTCVNGNHAHLPTPSSDKNLVASHTEQYVVRRDAAWHAEYARLERAAAEASETWRIARRALDRKRPPADAQAAYDAALERSRAASAARFDFEMAATKIVDIATSTDPREFVRALLPPHMRGEG